jgi:hypothetical protein
MPGGRRICPARRPTDARRCNREVAHRQAQSGASHEVLSPSAFTGRVALSGAASHRTLPLRRFDPVSARSHVFCSLATALVIALAVFRLASIQTVVFGCLPRWQVMRRRIFVAAVGDVPLPAIGSRGLIGVGQEGACPEARWRSWGFCPSQCCSCCRVACAAFPRAGPTCHSPERRPRYFSSRDRPPCPHTRSHPPTLHPTRDSIVRRHTGRPQSSGTVDQGRSGRLLGFGPGSSPRPPPLSRRSRWNAGSGGPILPWAFGLSQAFGSSHEADNSASTVTLTPADARDVPQAVGPRTLLEQSYPLIEIRT